MKARSPPESKLSDWSFLPGGWAIISIPVSSKFSGSVNSSVARPPPNKRGNVRSNWVLTASKVVLKRVVTSSSISVMVSSSVCLASSKSCCCAVKNVNRSCTASNSSIANKFTAPICSICCFRLRTSFEASSIDISSVVLAIAASNVNSYSSLKYVNFWSIEISKRFAFVSNRVWFFNWSCNWCCACVLAASDCFTWISSAERSSRNSLISVSNSSTWPFNASNSSWIFA